MAGILDGENENLMLRIFYFPKNIEEQNNKRAFTIDVHELKDQQFDLDLTDSDSEGENHELIHDQKAKKKTHYIAPFVAGFVIDGPLGDNILVATTDSFLIFDKYYET